MTRRETMITRYGEFRDLVSCYAVHNGAAKIKTKQKKMTFEEVIKLR